MMRKDASGVFFFAPAENVLDMVEMTDEDGENLFLALQALSGMDLLILDMKCDFRKYQLPVWKRAEGVVLVSDGRKASNYKVEKLVEALELQDRQQKTELCKKLSVAYNRLDNRTGTYIKNGSIRTLGGVPWLEIEEEAILPEISRRIAEWEI
jgi:hypothetical protein